MSNNFENIIRNYVFNNSIRLIFNSELGNHKDILDKIDSHYSKPLNFQICVNSKPRIIHFPNFFTYYYATKKIVPELESNQHVEFKNKSDQSFGNRLKIDYANRKFQPNNYTKHFQEDKNDLKFKYDRLSFFDISNFYGSIYTHCYERIEECIGIRVVGSLNASVIDKHLRLLNHRKTKGLLLGNALSITCADILIGYLCHEINLELNKEKIMHSISYFSDQFYIKHNNGDTQKINDTLQNVLKSDYFEFNIAEHKSKVFTYKDLINQTAFMNIINKLKKEFSFKQNKKINTTEKLVHFLNLLIYELVSDKISDQIKDTFLKVVLRSVFASPINLYYLHKGCDHNNSEIKTNVLFLITHYPNIVYDMFQLSMFEAIDLNEFITDSEMEIIYNKLHAKKIEEYAVIYWFIKVIIKKDLQHRDFEVIDFDYKLLGAFLIRNAHNLFINKFKDNLNEIINDSQNLFNKNWLLFYQYSLHSKNTIKLFEIPEKTKDNSNIIKKLTNQNSVINAANLLIIENVSIINGSDALYKINETSKRDRWSKLDVPNIIEILKNEKLLLEDQLKSDFFDFGF